MARKATAAKATKLGGGSATLLVIFGTMLAVTAAPMCILVVGGMVPTIVAALVDNRRGRYLSRTVAVTNLAGLVLPGMELLRLGVTFGNVQHILALPYMWLVMYGAAAVGWVLDSTMPAVARVIVDLRAERVKRQIEGRAEELVKEWGPEVRGAAAEDGPAGG